MTFRQVEVFLAVVRVKSFTRTAEALRLSQSTLSQHVLELERELGVRLFDRLGRAVTLTEAGRLLEEHAKRIRADELDLGVVGGHILRATEPCVAAGLLDELVLIVPPRHPWAKRREIAPDELAETPLLMREAGSATRLATERALRHADAERRRVRDPAIFEARAFLDIAQRRRAIFPSPG